MIIFHYYYKFINEFKKLTEKNDINFININDFEIIFGFNKLNTIKLLYYNRTDIHQILYDKEITIKIDGNIQNLSFYYYLSLLIFLNYIYIFFILKIFINNKLIKENEIIYYLFSMNI